MQSLCIIFVVGVMFETGDCLAPSFVRPPPDGSSDSFPEDTTVGTVIIAVDASDPDGQVLNFNVSNQIPDTPQFTINENDELIVPAGLDADTGNTEYNLTISATDGTTTVYTTYTLTITDVNDIAPIFNQTFYNIVMMEGSPDGTVVIQVFAEDPDITKQKITYSIEGSQTIFNVDTSGVITLLNSAKLTPGETITLSVVASDGQLAGYSNVIVQIVVSPCTLNPCMNGGVCTQTSYITRECSCPPGSFGDNCEKDAVQTSTTLSTAPDITTGTSTTINQEQSTEAPILSTTDNGLIAIIIALGCVAVVCVGSCYILLHTEEEK